jgi:dTDP-glucose 4,6-dehydratase
MKILITGGAGFIGSNYVNDLITRESEWTEVVVLDALTYAGNIANLGSARTDVRVKFVNGDIRDIDVVNKVMENTNTVVHFAAESHVDRSIKDPNNFVSTNVLGTSILLNSALKNGIKKFLHVSTDEVYGSIEKGSWTEDSKIAPNSPYSASKASSDLLAVSYWKTFGLPVYISRSSNNFGPYQFPEKFIPLAITNLIEGLPIPIYGNGLNSRDWLHVSDHCNGLNKILSDGAPGEIYNIGGGTEMSNVETAKMLLNYFDLDESYLRFTPDRLGHDFRYSVDYDKISQICGYKPAKNFETSIVETIKWYKSNETWWKPLKKSER